ncbi:MAG: sigma-70 family RNA polymerase sigma factor [Planctomycetota bacterium]
MHDDRFLSLFLRHERSLAAFARSMLPDWEAVDDVIQDASIVMWRKLDSLERDEDFLKWSFVIVRMETLKYRRGKARDRVMLSEGLVEKLASEAEDDCDERAMTFRSKALSACLDSFPASDQQLLLAPYVSRGSVTELASAAGTSANALYKKLGRLRLRLHQCIESRIRVGGEGA